MEGVKMLTQAEMDDHIANLRRQKQMVPHQFRQTISEIKMIVDGDEREELKKIRSEYYKDWSDGDLRVLLDQVNG
jgi:hypothetical protein